MNRARRQFLRLNLAAGLLTGSGGGFIAGCAYRHIPGFQFTPAIFAVHLAGTKLPAAPSAVLFGSVHAGLSRFYPLPRSIQNQFDNATHLAVELDMSIRFSEASHLFAPHVLLPRSTNLSSLVGAEFFNEMRKHFNWFESDVAQFERYAPWYVALTLQSKDDEDFGANRAVGLETVLIKQARAAGSTKRVIELETSAEQVYAFVGGTVEEQVQELKRRFRQIKAWDRTTIDIVDAWRLGDLNALSRLKTLNFGEYSGALNPIEISSKYPSTQDQLNSSITVAGTSQLPTLRQRMFEQRDALMADRLLALLKTLSEPDETRLPSVTSSPLVFALVGAFHLVGPDSLIEQLKQRGATVTRLAVG